LVERHHAVDAPGVDVHARIRDQPGLPPRPFRIVGFSPSPAEIVADGVSTSVVTVQTVSDDVKSGLKAKLTLAGANWFGGTGPTIEKEFGPDGLITATVLASRVPGEAKGGRRGRRLRASAAG
jgi:hypothetical protein